ncbi:MAG: cell envelope integrity EipB family protein [Alphaproteobacteria bacterium]|nr:cell envelope integrity EipB family protein [Alphaproteobacteria bacterium]
MTRRTIPGLLLCVITMLSVLPSPLAAVDLISHRAVYRMALERASSASGVADAHGTMLFELARQCDGWTVEQRYRLTMSYTDEDEAAELVVQFVTWESNDGRRYRFNVRKLRDGDVTEDIRGTATMPAQGDGVAEFTRPEATTLPLSAGAMFPTFHTLALLRAAVAGDRFVKLEVFDGGTVEGAYEVTAGIGRGQAADASAAHALLRAIWWPIRMAFFAPGDTSGQPEYELGVDLQENGITRAMVLDYGTFAIRATLQQVEALPAPQC